MKNNKFGFTLVELLAVIVILAIILVIAVPKVMSIIEDSKKATLESTAKMIASAAEKAFVQNTILGKTEKITCESVAKINNVDYQGCKIEFDDNGKALVTIIGNGKFKGYNVCKGSKNNSSAVEDSCSLVTLTINPNGGNFNRTYEQKYEAGVIVELAIPTKEGYTFSHWEVSGTNASVNNNNLTIGTTDTEVKAIYNGNQYSITYNLDGGNEIDNLETSGAVGTELTLPIPTKEGWTFTGWSVSGKNSVLNDNKLTIGIENVILTANWEVKFTDHITTLLSNESTLNNGLFVDDTADKNIRYAGATPNNKVYFNCKDKDSKNVNYGATNYDYASSCEVWRIIGVFNTKSSESDTVGAKRVKIVRDAFSVNMSWDSSLNSVNSGYGINEWSQADLQNMLNGYYIGVENATCTYCNGLNQGTCSNDCSSSVTPLSTTSVNMIDRVLWNTGTQTSSASMTVTAMYNAERGTRNGKICSSTSTNSEGSYLCTDTVTRTTTWEGLVGLIYPSDYGYASTDSSCSNDIYGSDSTCESNNWLHPSSGSLWTISPRAHSSFADGVWNVSSTNLVSADGARYAFGVRPSLYLSSSVKIVGGDGNTTPYKLAI